MKGKTINANQIPRQFYCFKTFTVTKDPTIDYG